MQKDVNDTFVPGETRIKYGGAFFDAEDREAIDAVLDRNWWTIDEEARKLELELADVTETEYATITNSGSSSLFVMYSVLSQLGYSGEIITGAVQFPTAISSMVWNGFEPVYVDTEKDNFCIDVKKIENAITDETVAILAVNIAGNMPDIDELIYISEKYGILLLLDNADGFGGFWDGKPVESFFDMAITSFHAAHILNMGEGGAIFTSNPKFNEVAHSIREWGRVGDTDSNKVFDDIPADYPGRYIFQYLGMNLKPLELQCALGRTQLKKLDIIKNKRSDNFDILKEGLRDVDQVNLPEVYYQCKASWFSFPMNVKDRAGLREFLESRNIETRTIFGGNIMRQPAYKNIGRSSGELTEANICMTDGMFVSVHPNSTPEMMDYVVKSIKEYYNEF